MTAPPRLQNFINGQYIDVTGTDAIEVTDPSNGSVISMCPITSVSEVDAAVQVAAAAQVKWAAQTYKTRVQPLFKLKMLMEEPKNQEKIIELIRQEHGKCTAEGKASLMKGIETLEWATSLPQLAAGKYLEVSRGITCREERAPLGVVASIVPFNFPVMVPFWTVPIAIGCGNAVILKPSEKVPMTMNFIAGLFKLAGVPDGIFQIVNGTQPTVDAILEHPTIKAVSFVGSSPVAKIVSDKGNQLGKRALCLGGAKNHLCALPDADFDMCTSDIMNSFAGSSGQRCMAASVCLLIDKDKSSFDKFLELLVKKAAALKPGQAAGEIGPVIDQRSKDRIVKYINEAESRDGAKVLVDGRSWCDREGYWVGPTILLHNSASDPAIKDEIFGPVLSVMYVSTPEEAIEIENSNPYGNAACIYTSVGQNSEWFLKRFSAAMLGVNIGVPVPREPFSFGGMNMSNFGCSDITGDGAMEFFTQRKKVTQKWVPPQGRTVVESSFIC